MDDRLAAFLTELRLAPPDADVLLVVTHGLAMRLLARRALGWSVALFEALSNPEPCEERVLTLDGGRWRLDRPFAQWTDRRRRHGAVRAAGTPSPAGQRSAGRTPRAPRPRGC